MSALDKRKEELERKRQKLAEIRRQREERAQSQQQSPSQSRPLSSVTVSSDRQQVDALVSALVGTSRPASAISDSSAPSQVEQEAQPQKLKNLGFYQATILDLPPKERIIYDKEIQTAPLEPEEEKEKELEAVNEKDQNEIDSQIKEKEVKIKEEWIKEELEKRLKQQEEKEKKKIEEKRQKWTDEESEMVLKSEPFIKFFEQSSKIIERALNEEYDVMKDYTISSDITSNGRPRTKLLVKFENEKCQNRMISALDSSVKFPELSLAAYFPSYSLQSQSEPDGLVLVWNTHLTQRPEFKFHASSAVTSAIFSPFHPQLVMGGSYAGQILLWDTRSGHLPVLKSPLSSSGHTHPVYCLKMVGTNNAHHLMSSSTDGMICSWQLDMLAKPIESLHLTNPQPQRSEEISATVFDFPENETTTFWVGTEEGNLFQANRYDRAGSKAGILSNEQYLKHEAPVTSLHFHKAQGAVDFSDIFLTCSLDWSIRLWKKRNQTSFSKTTELMQPLFHFDSNADCVYDVQWSPQHPSVFASVDGTGKLEFWNLNHSTEVPVESIQVSEKALNKISWDQQGTKCSVGGSDGSIYVYDVTEPLVHSSTEDYFHFQKVLNEMEQQRNFQQQQQQQQQSENHIGH